MVGKSKKIRLDIVLVAHGLADDVKHAQALIMAGAVYQGTVRLDKPGMTIKHDGSLVVKDKGHPWVSRGGIKLAHGLAHFGLDPSGLICVDVGCSTGGFSDVLLTGGAAKIYAVDVGHGQLDWKIRNNDRVVVLEKTNARHLDATLIPDLLDVIVCDASFIGLRTVLPAVMSLAAPQAFLIALIKPQFEVAREQVGKGGVVRDTGLHREVCETIEKWLETCEGWDILGISQSPIKGPQGNVEFLIAARLN